MPKYSNSVGVWARTFERSRNNMYEIKWWFAFYFIQIEFVYQAGRQLQKVDNANTPIPEIMLRVPCRHQLFLCFAIHARIYAEAPMALMAPSGHYFGMRSSPLMAAA